MAETGGDFKSACDPLVYRDGTLRLSSANLTIRRDPNINFCIRLLLEDGLRVNPFTRHEDGDKSLRAIGLTESIWRDWFEITVRLATDLLAPARADLQGLLPPPTDSKRTAEILFGGHHRLSPEVPEHNESFVGPSASSQWSPLDAVSVELLKRSVDYFATLKEKRSDGLEGSLTAVRFVNPPSSDVLELGGAERELWEEMFRLGQFSSFYFYAVDYPYRVVDIVPPASAVLGGLHEDDDDADYCALALEATRRLQALTQR